MRCAIKSLFESPAAKHGGGAPWLQNTALLAVPSSHVAAPLCRGAGFRVGKRLVALLLAVVALGADAVTVAPRPGTPAAARTAEDGATAEVAWDDSIESGMARAAAEGRPVLVYLWMPGCAVCRKLELTTLADPAVRRRLTDWICVRVNVAADRSLAAQMGVEATPTLALMASDGQPLSRITGYLSPSDLMAALTSGAEAAGGAGSAESARRGREALEWVKTGRVPPDRWPDVLLALGTVRDRQALVSGILALTPLPRAQLVALLAHPLLAVRLGALEVLEQAAGDDFGFDPWGAKPDAEGPPSAALARWQSWAVDTQAVVIVRFAALTREQIDVRLADLLSPDRDRAQRARRQLMEAGGVVAGPAEAFLASHTGLPAGLADRIREVRYAALLPARPGFDPAVQAQRLVCGNLDLQLQALRDLRAQKAAAVPVARDFLKHPNPLVRETAVDTLVATARRDAVPLLRDLLATEPNREVIVAAARGLGGLKGKSAGDLLAELLERDDEDIVIVALRSLAKNDAGAPGKAIIRRLGDARWRVRVAALQAARDLRLREAADAVEALLGDSDAFVRFTAIVALPKVCSEDRAARRLEKAFAVDTDKAPVIAAFGEMNRALPAGFAAQCAGKPAEVLLPVLEALQKCGKRGVPLATALATHPDGDVACAALAVLARTSARSNAAALLEALRRGSRGQVLAVLEGLRTDEDDSHSYTSSDDRAFDDVLAELSDGRAAGGGSAADGAPSAVAELLEAFLAPGSNAAPAAIAAPAAPATVAIGELFEAFDATQTVVQASAPTNAPVLSGSFRDLAEAVRGVRGRFASDAAIQHAALVALLKLGDTNALPDVARRLDGMSDSDRAAVADVLEAIPTAESAALLGRLLRDGDPRVRRTAAGTLGAQLQKADWCDTLFGELAREGTPLRLVEAAEPVMQGELKTPAAAGNVRSWAERFLDRPPAPAFELLAVMLYEKTGRRQDMARLTSRLGSDDPLMRRAAYRSLAKIDPAGRGALLDQAARDRSELVRAVVPAILGTGSGQWAHKLGEKESFVTWQWSSRDRRLKEGERQALRRMVSDPVPELRAETLIALMSAGEPFEAAELMNALAQSSNGAGLSSRAANALEASYEKLNNRYAALLPLLDAGRISEETRDAITRRLSGPAVTASALPVALRPPASVVEPAAAVPAAAPAVVTAAATNAMRVVFFHAIGCEDCETARGYLKTLQDAFPEMRVESHEMGEDASRALNEALCERFHVPEAQRGRTPTIMTGAGYLVGREITFESLSDLLARSLGAALATPASRIR